VDFVSDAPAIIRSVAEKKVANSVVALSSAAVLAIYGAGYARTREAADRFAQQAADRRPHIPAPRDDGPAGTTAAALAAPATAPIASAALPVVPADPAAPSRASDAASAGSSAPAAAPVSPVPTPPKTESLIASNNVETQAGAEGDTLSTPASSMGATPSTPPAPPAAVVVTPVEPAKSAYKDGTYYGWGTSRHGDIQAAVVIEDGRITIARVERCLTRYSCSWITPIPPRILSKQATTYDYVSGATESSDAFQDAVSEALSQAK
jgi:uncharacterized protein with FMN-binding domain